MPECRRRCYRLGVTIQPWKHRGGSLDARRYELFLLAAPVFERQGFHGATVKALAHACHLSPAGLYHYFSSKEELATWLLRGPRMSWDSTYVDPDLEPLEQLRQLIDLSLTSLPVYLLALRLAEEVEGGASPRDRQAGFREGEAVYGRLIHAAAPRLSKAEALEMARHVLAVLIGTATIGLDPEPMRAIRARSVAVVRAALVPEHVDADWFDAVMSDDPENRTERVIRSVPRKVG
jgi:AcrR family transcriptional regulator